MWHKYTMKYYSAIKRNEFELVVVSWMNLEPLIYSEVSQKEMTTGKTIALTRQTFVGKVMSLLFNMLSRLVITFLPRFILFPTYFPRVGLLFWVPDVLWQHS